MLDVEDLVVEVAIHPAECAQFASTRSQSCIEKHEELIAKLELGQNLRHMKSRFKDKRLTASR